MDTLKAIFHWLFDCQNPFVLFGFFATIIWIYYSAVNVAWFFSIEIPGLRGWHGMVPFTYVLRCLPRAFYIAAAALIIWHFDIASTIWKGIHIAR